ncbi:nucleoside-triphosphate diphosphatase [Streptococcus pacificus]|uniref:dITP/XTP pyrophosphatase n=1 Tax=Streptococcus pacificus TaxID=2740577 RepID=A0ABS0ZK49_9STRE|nr:nucleoside-triphosphate diphosphatase [Streptococcus pacificus]MBJ8326088.1 nucleoside-triphosphate diphosphatase [Streptococcus pacificus]
MNQKIYDYQTNNDWYVGKWDKNTQLTSFESPDKLNEISLMVSQLFRLEETKGIQLHVVKFSSAISLLTFVADMVNDRYGKTLSVVNHKGAILLIEEEKVLSVYLPKEGMSFTDLFGQGELTSETIGDSILIATRNNGKTKEFKKFFAKLGIKVENLNDHPELPEVEETGTTFEENARLKAETISQLTGKMVLADDSGLKVDALGGLPGVWSARFSGADATDSRNNAKLLHELAMVLELKDRKAQFHTTLAVAAPDKETFIVEADWDGYIAHIPKGENGFGYDPLFLVGETGKTAAELSAEEKNAMSHRGQAVKKLMEVFSKWQNSR